MTEKICLVYQYSNKTRINFKVNFYVPGALKFSFYKVHIFDFMFVDILHTHVSFTISKCTVNMEKLSHY